MMITITSNYMLTDLWPSTKKKKERKHFDMNQRMTLAPHDSQYNDQFPK